MTTLPCPRCGYPIEVTDLQRMYMFAGDLDATLCTARQVQRDFGVIRIRSMAAALAMSSAHTWRALRVLEAIGALQRIGKRGGWIVNREFSKNHTHEVRYP